jgi:hypothetical protein
MFWICLSREELELLINELGSKAWDLAQVNRDGIAISWQEADRLKELEKKLKFFLEHDR